MKKKILYHFLAALLILCVGSLAVFWDMNKRQSIKEIGFDQLPTLEEKYFQKNIDAINKAEETGDLKTRNEAEANVKNSLTPRLTSQWQMARDRLSKISFYGKVVDQNGIPVSEANVRVTVGGGGPWATGKGDGWYETDSDGIFKVEGRGESITVLSIDHPMLSKFKTIATGSGAVFFPFPRNGSNGNWTHYQDKKNPFIFKAWREESFGSAALTGVSFTPPPTGEYYSILLTPWRYGGLVWKQKESPGVDSDGLIAVKCVRENDVHDSEAPYKYLRTGSWRITLRAINGGIQFAKDDDVYLNLAPEQGYLPEIIIGSQAGKEGYVRTISDQKIYVKAKNGKIYASMILTFRPFDSEDYCSVQGYEGYVKYTTDGTRNLAIKQKLKR